MDVSRLDETELMICSRVWFWYVLGGGSICVGVGAIGAAIAVVVVVAVVSAADVLLVLDLSSFAGVEVDVDAPPNEKPPAGGGLTALPS